MCKINIIFFKCLCRLTENKETFLNKMVYKWYNSWYNYIIINKQTLTERFSHMSHLITKKLIKLLYQTIYKWYYSWYNIIIIKINLWMICTLKNSYQFWIESTQSIKERLKKSQLIKWQIVNPIQNWIATKIKWCSKSTTSLDTRSMYLSYIAIVG